ncbi:MAG: DUF2341 domain-containing protein [Chloroflexota bacterium]|nr:DUF2341 domain-containing protein [Chloroflexota bacterium]
MIGLGKCRKKKGQKGFTVLSVVLALGITALVIPTLTMAIGATMQVPNEVSADLVVSHDINQATELIIQDGNVAESFTEVPPEADTYGEYYGTFCGIGGNKSQSISYRWDSEQHLLIREEVDTDSGKIDSRVIASGIANYEDVQFVCQGTEAVEVRMTITSEQGETTTKSFMVSLIAASDGFGYRIPIILTNGSDQVLQDYQMPIELGDGFNFSNVVDPNGGDIRFRNENTGTDLSFWIQQWDVAEDGLSGTAKIWVKVDELPANDEIAIHMYYGSPHAESISSVANTFDTSGFLDEFEDSSLIDMSTSTNIMMSDSGEVQLVILESIPNYSFEENNSWDYRRSDLDLDGFYSSLWSSHESRSARLDMDLSGSVSRNDYTEVRQDIDLTGINTIVFDTKLRAERNGEFVAEVRVDSDVLWSKTITRTTTVYIDEIIDVSEYNGVQWVSFRVRATEWTNDEFVAYYDNIRAIGQDQYITSGTLRSLPIPTDSDSRFAVGNLFDAIDTQPEGTSITYHVEYSSDNGTTWQLIPDSTLQNNSTGLISDDISTITPDYELIRLVANLSTDDSSVTPSINVWGTSHFCRMNPPIPQEEPSTQTVVPEDVRYDTSSGVRDARDFDLLSSFLESLDRIFNHDYSMFNTQCNPQHIFKFKIDTPVEQIEQLNITWAGGNGFFPSLGAIEIWNDDSNDWDDMGGLWLLGAWGNTRTTRSLENDDGNSLSQYIDDEGYLYVTVYDKKQLGMDRLYSDYAAVEIITTQGESSTLSYYFGAETSEEEER